MRTPIHTIVLESTESPYANLIVVRRGDEGAAWVRRLVTMYQTEEVKRFVEATFQGAVVPAF